MTVTIGVRHGTTLHVDPASVTPSSQALGTVEPCVIDARVMPGWDDRL
jgi:hypothetical protein